MTMKAIPVLSLMTLAFAVSAPAHAADISLQYQAHELATNAGAAKLYTRINATAKRACSNVGPRPIYERQVETACMNFLISDLVKGVDDSRLDQVHADVQGQQRYAETR